MLAVKNIKKEAVLSENTEFIVLYVFIAGSFYLYLLFFAK